MGDITHFLDDVTCFTKQTGTGTWNHALNNVMRKHEKMQEERKEGWKGGRKGFVWDDFTMV